LHNKPIGCGASGAYAPGPDDEECRCSSHTFLIRALVGGEW